MAKKIWKTTKNGQKIQKWAPLGTHLSLLHWGPPRKPVGPCSLRSQWPSWFSRWASVTFSTFPPDTSVLKYCGSWREKEKTVFHNGGRGNYPVPYHVILLFYSRPLPRDSAQTPFSKTRENPTYPWYVARSVKVVPPGWGAGVGARPAPPYSRPPARGYDFYWPCYVTWVWDFTSPGKSG